MKKIKLKQRDVAALNRDHSTVWVRKSGVLQRSVVGKQKKNWQGAEHVGQKGGVGADGGSDARRERTDGGRGGQNDLRSTSHCLLLNLPLLSEVSSVHGRIMKTKKELWKSWRKHAVKEREIKKRKETERQRFRGEEKHLRRKVNSESKGRARKEIEVIDIEGRAREKHANPRKIQNEYGRKRKNMLEDGKRVKSRKITKGK